MKWIVFSLCILGFSSCAMVEIKNHADVCSDQRLQSSQKRRCLAHFEENNLSAYIDKAGQSNGGLALTKFTSTNGDILKAADRDFVHNPKQVVSFYTETNSDGTPNRGGVMIQGTPTEIMFGQDLKPAYIFFGNQRIRILEFSASSEGNPKQAIQGQGYDRHPAGFGSPMGLLKGWKNGIAEYSIQELKSLFEQYTKDNVTRLEFESGVVVTGIIEKFTENRSGNYRSPTVITFRDCEVKLGNRLLHHRDAGPYDMILVTTITDPNTTP